MARDSVLFILIFLLFSPRYCAAQSQNKPPDGKVGKPPGRVSPTPAPGLPSHFEKAESLLKEGKFAEAINEYRSSLEDHPDNEAAYFGIASAQTQLGLTTDAVGSYEAALKINPQLWEAETNLGMLLMRQQSFNMAMEHFQKGLALNPKSFQCAFSLAKALESLSRWREAAEAGLRALPLAEDNVEKFDLHASLGTLYLKAGVPEEAKKHLLAATQLGKDPALELELAQLYLQSDELDKSAALLEPLASKHPEDASIQEILGRVLLERGSTEAAIDALEKALKHKTDAEARQGIVLVLAQAFQKLSQPEKAIALLQPVATQSKDASLHFYLGTLYLQQRAFDGAAQSFLEALRLKPDCIECYSNLGSVFMLQEKYREAITALSRFKTARPDAAGTYFYLGIAFDKLDDVENAVLHYQRFLALDEGKNDKQSFQARERLKVLEKRRKKH
jgi:protein O-GlcNAc transferase